MSPKIFAIIVVLVLIARSSNGQVALTNFLPYGTANGDTDLKSLVGQDADDVSSPAQALTNPFKFYGSSQTSLFVNINGGVSFNGAISTYTPTCAPLTEAMSMIAPFWADWYLRAGQGSIYFRQTTEQGVLDKAIVDIRAAFPQYPSTQAMKWAYIATWDHVGFYGQVITNTNKTNTMQMALLTDGQYSFVIFNYNDIEWTTGTASGGTRDGLGGIPARAGFDNGKGKMTILPGSCNADIINIVSKSGINVPGKFVYQVDGETIVGPGTVTMQTITDTVTRTTVTEPMPPSTTRQQTTPFPDEIKKRKDELERNLKVLRVRVLADCTRLIERPALEHECYHELENLDNLLHELPLIKFIHEIERVEMEVERITEVMDRIEKDIRSFLRK